MRRGAFKSCSKLQEIVFSKQTLSRIEAEAFFDLPNLQILDLSNQLLTELPSKLVHSLQNLTHVDLSSNKIGKYYQKISENIFYDVPNLVNLDLSQNNICHIDNMLDTLRNPDLIVDLSENNLNYLIGKIIKE